MLFDFNQNLLKRLHICAHNDEYLLIWWIIQSQNTHNPSDFCWNAKRFIGCIVVVVAAAVFVRRTLIHLQNSLFGCSPYHKTVGRKRPLTTVHWAVTLRFIVIVEMEMQPEFKWQSQYAYISLYRLFFHMHTRTNISFLTKNRLYH